jgi:hypothetical protein
VRLYLDDDVASPLLAKLLRNTGNDIQLPSEAAIPGQPDPVHLTHAIGEDRYGGLIEILAFGCSSLSC